MDRATIGVLNAWNPATRRFVTLQPGTLLRSCHVFPARPVGPEERPVAYAAEFEVDGQTYRCPLYGFLPRTLVLLPV